MTYEEREQIFSKEVITIQEFAKLFSCSLSEASVKMNDIKRRVGDRCGIKGKIHVQDYIDCYKLNDLERYKKPEEEQQVKQICVADGLALKSVFFNREEQGLYDRNT